MSETATAPELQTDAPTSDAPLFEADELKQFDADDVEAGRNICKMLSLFFFYTVIVMGISTLVTLKWVMP